MKLLGAVKGVVGGERGQRLGCCPPGAPPPPPNPAPSMPLLACCCGGACGCTGSLALLHSWLLLGLLGREAWSSRVLPQGLGGLGLPPSQLLLCPPGTVEAEVVVAVAPAAAAAAVAGWWWCAGGVGGAAAAGSTREGAAALTTTSRGHMTAAGLQQGLPALRSCALASGVGASRGAARATSVCREGGKRCVLLYCSLLYFSCEW